MFELFDDTSSGEGFTAGTSGAGVRSIGFGVTGVVGGGLTGVTIACPTLGLLISIAQTR